MKRHFAVVAALVVFVVGLSPSARASSADGLRVVSIGDSFIAGNGNTNYYPGQGPNQADIGGPRVPADGRNCFQSYSSYPWQYVQKLNDSGHQAEIWHAACGGAWTYDLIPQWNTIPEDWRSSADVILISAGGNDAGFSDVAARCVMSLPQGGTCDGALDHGRRQLPGVIDRLSDAITTIRSEAPDAQIAVVGYPWLTSPAKQRCPSRGEAELLELQWKHDISLVILARDLNRASGNQNVHAVTVSSRFADRGPCAWANPLLHDYLAADGERFHPNWWGAWTYAEILFDYRLHEVN